MKLIPGFDRYYADADGNIFSGRRKHIFQMKVDHRPDGYLRVSLFKGSSRKSYYVHRLVALTFIGPCPKGLEVAHNNGMRNDNRVENLRYATHSGNMLDQHFHNTVPDISGEKHPQLKINRQIANTIRDLYSTGLYTQTNLANTYGISQTHVSDIVRRRQWI